MRVNFLRWHWLDGFSELDRHSGQGFDGESLFDPSVDAGLGLSFFLSEEKVEAQGRPGDGDVVNAKSFKFSFLLDGVAPLLERRKGGPDIFANAFEYSGDLPVVIVDPEFPRVSRGCFCIQIRKEDKIKFQTLGAVDGENLDVCPVSGVFDSGLLESAKNSPQRSTVSGVQVAEERVDDAQAVQFRPVEEAFFLERVLQVQEEVIH